MSTFIACLVRRGGGRALRPSTFRIHHNLPPRANAVLSPPLSRPLTASAALQPSTSPATCTHSPHPDRLTPSPSIPDLLRLLSKFHSHPTRVVDLRRYLDLLQSSYHEANGVNRPLLTRGHVSLVMKAAKTCQHPSIAFWLLHTFYPPPPSPPSTPIGPWPKDVETAFQIITAAVDASHPPQSPQILSDLLLFLSQHGYPVLPSMLTPSLLFYKHFQAWPSMLALHSHCTSHSIPIPNSAYPLILVALNHTRQWQAALTVVTHAESTLLPFTPLPRLYPIYHAAIDCLGVCNKGALALAMYERMKAKGLPPKVESYTALINALVKDASEGDAGRGLAVVKRLHGEVEAAGLSVSQPLYRGLIRAYLRFDAQEEAMRLMQRFVQLHHDAASHFFVLSVCVEVNNVEAALLMLDKVRERREGTTGESAKKAQRRLDWTVHVPVYNRILDLCVRERKWKAVRRVWDLRGPLHVSPNILTFYLVAQALKPQSPSWQTLLDSAVPLLPLTSTPSILALTVPPSLHEHTAAASLWWTLKAVEVGYGDCGDRDLRVDLGHGGRGGVVERVKSGLAVRGEEWMEEGVEVRWSKDALKQWKESRLKAATPPQPQEKEELESVRQSASPVLHEEQQRRVRQPAANLREEASEREMERDGLFGFGELSVA